MITAEYINPKGFLGDNLNIILKAGATIQFHVLRVTQDSLIGVDELGMELTISLTDIEMVWKIKEVTPSWEKVVKIHSM